MSMRISLNGISVRSVRCRPRTVAVVVAITVVYSLMSPFSLGGAQVDIRMTQAAGRNTVLAESTGPRTVIRSARVPRVVQIDLGATSGIPVVPEESVEKISRILDENPRRLVTLRFKGGALEFGGLSPATQEALLRERGESVVELYNRYIASQVLQLVEKIKQERPRSPLAVYGLPFEGRSRRVQSANATYRTILDRLSAIVVSGGIIITERDDEVRLLGKAFPNALEAAGDRAILFTANGGWRIALDANRFASEELSKKRRDVDGHLESPESNKDEGGLTLVNAGAEKSAEAQASPSNNLAGAELVPSHLGHPSRSDGDRTASAADHADGNGRTSQGGHSGGVDSYQTQDGIETFGESDSNLPEEQAELGAEDWNPSDEVSGAGSAEGESTVETPSTNVGDDYPGEHQSGEANGAESPDEGENSNQDGSEEVDASESSLPCLIDGGVLPGYHPGAGQSPQEQSASASYSWARFVEGGTDGFGRQIVGNNSDPRIGSMQIPARFLTPYQASLDSTDEVDVLVHPYGGVDQWGESNEVEVLLYLNGGPPVRAQQRTLVSGPAAGTVVYSAAVPAGIYHDVNELRAIVFPRYGRPAILQCAGMLSSEKDTDLASVPGYLSSQRKNSWFMQKRGVLLIKYESIQLSASIPTVNAAVESVGHTRVACVADGMFSEDSAGLFSSLVYTQDAVNESDPYLPLPRVMGGSFVWDSYPNSDAKCLGVVVENARLFACIDDETPLGNAYAYRSNQQYRPGYFQFESCHFEMGRGVATDTGLAATPVGQLLNERGFGKVLSAYDRGLIPEVFGLYPRDPSSTMGVGCCYFGCSAKYVVLRGDEYVGHKVYACPPQWGDVMGYGALHVNVKAFGVHMNMFPWGSIGADQISYDFDWDLYATGDASLLPNSGRLTPSSGEVMQSVNRIREGLSGSLFSRGGWPDWLYWPGVDRERFDVMYDPEGDGVYEDHYGLSYHGWDKWGGSGPFQGSLDIHFDLMQVQGWQPGYVIGTGIRTYGDGGLYQGIYYTNLRVDSVAVWDVQLVEIADDLAGAEISIGAETRVDPQGGSGHRTGGNASQMWGPGFFLTKPDGSPVEHQAFRNFIAGEPSELRGFTFVGDQLFVENVASRNSLYSMCGVADNGTSRVKRGVDEDQTDYLQSDNWWVVDVSR